MSDRSNNLTTMALSRENYDRLKRYGFATESMNDALARILKRVEEVSKAENK